MQSRSAVAPITECITCAVEERRGEKVVEVCESLWSPAEEGACDGLAGLPLLALRVLLSRRIRYAPHLPPPSANYPLVHGRSTNTRPGRSSQRTAQRQAGGADPGSGKPVAGQRVAAELRGPGRAAVCARMGSGSFSTSRTAPLDVPVDHPGQVECARATRRASAVQHEPGRKSRTPLMTVHLRGAEGQTLIAVLTGHPIFYIVPPKRSPSRRHQIPWADPLASSTFYDEFPTGCAKTPAVRWRRRCSTRIIAGLGNTLKCEILFEMRYAPSVRVGALLASQLTTLPAPSSAWPPRPPLLPSRMSRSVPRVRPRGRALRHLRDAIAVDAPGRWAISPGTAHLPGVDHEPLLFNSN